MPTETQDVQTKYRECKITIVMPGSSDRVLKVFPADGESEKVWLDNTQGIERWEAIKRFLQQYVKRGEAVPAPRAYCEGKDLRTVVITEEDIPLARLEDGAIFKVKLPERVTAEQAVKLNPSVENLQLRMDKMESGLAQLADGMATLLKAQNTPPEPAKRGRPKKEEV